MKRFLPYSKTIAAAIAMVLLVAFGQKSFGQVTGDYRSNIAAGNWNVRGNWQRWNGAAWAAVTVAQGYPGQNATPPHVYIVQGDNITLNVTPANPVAILQIGTSTAAIGTGTGTLTFGAFTLTVTNTVTLGVAGSANTGTVTMTAGGTLICGSIVDTYNGTGTANTWTYGTGTLELTANNTLPATAAFANYYSLNVNGAGATTTLSQAITVNKNVTLTAGTLSTSASNYNITVAGNWTDNGGVFTAGTGTVDFDGAAAQTIGGTASTTFNTLDVNNTVGVTLGIATTAANLTIGDVTANSIFKDGGFQLTSSGTLNFVSGTFTLGAAAATAWPGFATNTIAAGTTVDYNANAAQTVSTAPTYSNLTITGTGVKTVSTTPLNVGANILLTAGTLTVGANNINVGGNWTRNGGAFTAGTGTVDFDGAAAQTIGGTATTTFNTLDINNTVGVTLGRATTATNLTIGDVTANSLFKDGGFQLTSTGTLNFVSGTFTLGAAAATAWPGFATNTIAAGTTVDYNANAAQTVSTVPTYSNLTISGTGVKTVSTTPLNAGGNILLTAGTLTVGANSINVGGNWTNNGGTFTSGTGTVTFDGTGAQAINGTAAAQTFNNIIINESAGNALSVSGSTVTLTAVNFTETSGDFNAPATLNLSGVATLTSGTFTAGAQINMSGASWTNDGSTFAPGTGTVTFNGAVAQAINGTAASQTFNNVIVDLTAGITLSVGGSTTTLSTNNFTETRGNFTAPATLNISGVATFTAGTFTAGATVNVSGAGTCWVRNGGVFTAGTGTVNFDGTAAETIGGTARTTFSTLTINNAAGVTLGRTTTTTNLTIGNITAGSIFSDGGFQLTATGTLDFVSGTFNLGAATATVWPGFGTNTIAAGTTVDYNANAAQTVSAVPTYSNLTISGTGTKTLPASPLNVNANVLLTAGTLTVGIHNIFVGGNWTNNGGTFTAGTGTVTFNGSTVQTIGGSVTTGFHNLTINQTGTGSITLSVPSAAGGITVGAALTLTNGIITSTSAFPITVNNGGSTSGASNASFVDGPITKIGTNAFTFPVGVTGTGYVPIGISAPAAATDAFLAQYIRSSAKALPSPGAYSLPNTTLGIDHVSNCDYWILNQTVGTSTVNVTGYWNANNPCNGEIAGGYVNDMTTIVLAHYNASIPGWDAFGTLGNTTGNTLAGSVTWTGVSNFSPFSLASTMTDNPLPLVLVNFNAVLNSNKTTGLTWTTEQESNLNYFAVERSADGIQWVTIGSVQGKGNSVLPTDYAYTDQEPLSGANYYRLSMVNTKGDYSFSIVKVVNLLQVKGISVYPNPARDYINVSVSQAKTDLNVKLINQLGQQLQVNQVKAGTSVILTLDVHNYAQGSYFLQVSGADGTQQTSKVLIMR